MKEKAGTLFAAVASLSSAQNAEARLSGTINDILGGRPGLGASAEHVGRAARPRDRSGDGHPELPLDELGVALDEKLVGSDVLNQVVGPREYVRDHLSATDAADRAWVTEVSGGSVEKVDGVDNLVLRASLAPASGPVGDFVLHYDAVMDRLISHRVFVSARYGSTGRTPR